MPGTEDGPGPILQVRSSGQRNGGYRLPADAGRPTGGGPARPQGFRPKGRGARKPPAVAGHRSKPNARTQMNRRSIVRRNGKIYKPSVVSRIKRG